MPEATFEIPLKSFAFAYKAVNSTRHEDGWFTVSWHEVTVSEKGEDLAEILGLFQVLDFPGDIPATDSFPAAVSGQTCRHWKYQECRCRDKEISLVRGLL